MDIPLTCFIVRLAWLACSNS